MVNAHEPGLPGKPSTSVYFNRWQIGKYFSVAAWLASSDAVLKIGDPFVKK